MTGIFYLISTPIGNLNDISLRAINTLTEVDYIVAEDTRVTRKLLNHFQINTKCISYHEHSSANVTTKIINDLQQGNNIGLVSDAGTPLISDPGFSLVSKLKELNITVIPIPGVTAAITALTASGLPTDSFCFIGFLPAKVVQLHQILRQYNKESKTIICYQTANRLMLTLEQIVDIYGPEYKICVAKELTKIHELILTQSAADQINYFKQHANKIRGEFVLLLSGNNEKTLLDTKNLEDLSIEVNIKKLMLILLQKLPVKEVVNTIACTSKINKNLLYTYALKLKNNFS